MKLTGIDPEAWKKFGLIFKPDNETDGLHSYCSVPMFFNYDSNINRIYFGSRNIKNQTSIHFLETTNIEDAGCYKLNLSPILSRSKPGYFDDNGVYPGSIIRHKEYVYMFYSGRSNGLDSVYYMNIGLAISSDNGDSFNRFSDSPILSRSKYDPWFVTAPYVFKHEDYWIMIYTSGIIFESRSSSFYDLKIATSYDLFNWNHTGITAVPLRNDESNISTPSVIKQNDTYHLWFSVKPRNGSYRIGHATSKDALTWNRTDKLELLTSEQGFDSISVSYPDVFKFNSSIYMAYSGNQNGLGGLGLAKLNKGIL